MRYMAAAMELCSPLRPDLLLMDLRIPDQRSVTPEQIQSCFPQPKLIAMSLWIDDETKVLADRLGAKVLLDQSSLAIDLIPVIRLCAKV